MNVTFRHVKQGYLQTMWFDDKKDLTKFKNEYKGIWTVEFIFEY